MRSILDEATDPWGIKINRVEVKNIIPPRDIQEAMEKQMRAERERREKILQAEGEKKSSILIAEGEKESAILRAEANKESKIKMAEGEAEALLKIKEAEAQGIELLKKAKADKSVIALKSLDALTKVANGKCRNYVRRWSASVLSVPRPSGPVAVSVPACAPCSTGANAKRGSSAFSATGSSGCTSR